MSLNPHKYKFFKLCMKQIERMQNVKIKRKHRFVFPYTLLTTISNNLIISYWDAYLLTYFVTTLLNTYTPPTYIQDTYLSPTKMPGKTSSEIFLTLDGIATLYKLDCSQPRCIHSTELTREEAGWSYSSYATHLPLPLG